MAQNPLITYQDLYEHICDSFDLDDIPSRGTRNARRAVLSAYRDLTRLHRWEYFNREYILVTVAKQTTGSIEYTNSTRTVTLTGATFPTNARLYKIIISDVVYEIDSYTSSTEVVLRVDSNPGADVSSGTSYTLFRDTYELPNDVRRVHQVWDTDSNFQLFDQRADSQMAISEVAYSSPATPWFYTIRASGDRVGGMAIVLTPPTDTATKFAILYEATPRALRIQEYSLGTVTTSGTTVTLSDGVLPLDIVGSVIRVSTNETKPTALVGGLSEGNNQYYEERVITARASDTSCTIESALTSDQTNVAYTISDPLDLEPVAMLSALQLRAETEYCRLAGLDKEYRLRKGLADQEFRLAIESDRRMGTIRPVASFNALRRSTISTDS